MSGQSGPSTGLCQLVGGTEEALKRVHEELAHYGPDTLKLLDHLLSHYVHE